jgi:hypothetical protein
MKNKKVFDNPGAKKKKFAPFFHRVIIFLSNPFSLSALRRKRKSNNRISRTI